MKYTKRISVVMPCYNAQRYISQAISSILAQSFKDFELIIINDGSTDGTELAVEKFSDERVKYIKFARNQGNYSARNLGIKVAVGKYIAMMDADDISLSNRLEIQYSFLEKNKSIGCIGSLGQMINDRNQLVGEINHPTDYYKLNISLLENNHLTQSTLMIRHHLIKKHSLCYDDSLRFSGDYQFVVQAIKLFHIVNLPERLVQYRVHQGQISKINRDEQISSADNVRIMQLQRLMGICENDEIEFHQRLMKNQLTSRLELDKAIEWLNRLVDANQILKLYSKEPFMEFCKTIMFRCIKKIKNGNIGT